MPKRGILTGLLLLTLLPCTCLAAGRLSPPHQTVLDSLAAWHHRSRPDRVDSLAAREIPLARAAGDSTYLLNLLLHTGRTGAAFGRARQAEPALREACQLAEAAGDTAALLPSLRWLSVAVGRLGRSQEAAEQYRRLLTLAEAADDSVHQGWGLLGVAYDHYLNSRSAQAVEVYGQAAGILERQGVARGALWAVNGQGLARRQAGDFTGAQASFRRCLELARAQADPLSEAMALNYLGRLDLMVGDPQEAVDCFEQAAAIHDRFQHRREGLLPRLDIAQARTLQGRFTEAAAGLDTLLAAAVRLGFADLELLATGQLADVRLAQGRPAAAADLCRRALARPEFPSGMSRLELQLRLARALAARDSFSAALVVLEEGVAQGGGAAALELRALLQMNDCLLAVGRPAEALAVARRGEQLARSTGTGAFLTALGTAAGRACLAAGQPDSAWALVQRAEADWEKDRALPTDLLWREMRGAAASELFVLGARLLGTHSAREAFDFCRRYKARTLAERMAGPGRTPPPDGEGATTRRLQRDILQPGQVLLDVVCSPQASAFFLVSRDTVLWGMGAGSRAAGETLARLGDVLTSPAVTDPDVAEALARRALALPPGFAEELARAREVVWCPDGVWQGLPLALLRQRNGEGLLPGDCDVTRIPAARFLTAESPAAPVGPAPEILALAGHDSTGGGFLPGAAWEVGWLERNFRNVRLGSGSRPDLVTTGILHLAAHAEVDFQQPWNTALVLGAGPEGRLRAAEVAKLRLPARLAVLASCRSAGSRAAPGEGLLGLTAAFLSAGTPTVVATLWPVEDAATALFMQDFYRALATGETVATAVRLAQERRRADPATAAAGHWAGFVVVGEGRQTAVPARRTSRFPLAGAGLLLAVGLVWRGRRLRS